METVREVAVTAREDKEGTKYLCVYVVAGKTLKTSELRSFMSGELPDYMIPSQFIQIDKIPLNSSDKIDYNALPEVDIENNSGLENVDAANENETKLVEIFKSVLGVENVGVTDDFFLLGGQSITAMKIAVEAVKYKIPLNVSDVFRYRTIRNIADRFDPNYKGANDEIEKTYDYYRFVPEQTHNDENLQAIQVNNVLLTGATGFLGVHLLDAMLENENVKLYCLIRGENEIHAAERLKSRLEFYFGNKYDGFINERIFIVKGDITEEFLGMAENEFSILGKKLDLIIHAGATVKHFGEYAYFEKINVTGTQSLVNFALNNDIRFAYMSTVSVSGSYVKGEAVQFCEHDFYIGQDFEDDVYIKSKFEAENLIYKAMENGLKATVYRVGNLTGRHSDGHFQINADENAFYNMIIGIIRMGSIPESLLSVPLEFTPVDECSKAIVKLMSTDGAYGRAFHIYNDKRVCMNEAVEVLQKFDINLKLLKDMNMKDYVELFAKDNPKDSIWVVPYINVGDENGEKYPVSVDCSSTTGFLSKVGFEWSQADDVYLFKLFEHIHHQQIM